VRIAIDKNMPFHGQLDPLAQRPLFLELPAHDPRSRFNDILFNVHQRPPGDSLLIARSDSDG
jgi:hypothetical protein